MLKKYKNELFSTIKNSELDIDNFEVLTDFGASTTIIKYSSTPFKFVLQASRDSFELFNYQHTLFNPRYSLSNLFPTSGFVSFANVLPNVTAWIEKHLKPFLEEQTEVDLWEEYKKGDKLLNIERIDFNDKSFFSLDEKQQISLAIQDLKFLIVNQFQLQGEEIRLIHERLDYLIEASDRLNKFDWKSLIISTIFSIITTLTLDTEKGQQLFNLFKKVFQMIPQLSEAASL